MAEGMASGADEALVFDSLAEPGRSDEWPKVLDQATSIISVQSLKIAGLARSQFKRICDSANVDRNSPRSCQALKRLFRRGLAL
jgi:hypothetical protein